MPLKTPLLLYCVVGTLLLSCKTPDTAKIHQHIAERTDVVFDSLAALRRDFHTYPETAGNEQRTAQVIADYLSRLGLEVQTGVAGHGVVGILQGTGEGKNIAWRADMDALPHGFPEDVPYRSKNEGIQHGCGHDVHMAIALGIADVLTKHKGSFPGTVYFIFQPEEETFVGAKEMTESDVLSELAIDEIYALHVTALPVGQIMVKPEELYAYQKGIQLRFDDQFPQEAAARLYERIRSEMLRKNGDGNPWEIPMAFDTLNGLNHPNTIFNDYLFLEENFVLEEDDDQLYIKAFAYETRKSNLPAMLPEIEQIIYESGYRDKLLSLSFTQENPTVWNDPRLTQTAVQTLTTIYGKNAVWMDHGQIPYFNDDFFYFQEKAPGVYFLLGGSNAKKGIVAMNHAPDFQVDEECIRVAVRSFSSLIFERAQGQ